MKAVRKRKLLTILVVLMTITVAAGFILYALRQNISLFYTPSQVAAGQTPKQRLIRLGGMVVKGSLKRSERGLMVEFALSDFSNTVLVNYEGILPDLFREGQGVVVTGVLLANHRFRATQVLAKHDENYMPPELRSALKKQGQA